MLSAVEKLGEGRKETIANLTLWKPVGAKGCYFPLKNRRVLFYAIGYALVFHCIEESSNSSDLRSLELRNMEPQRCLSTLGLETSGDKIHIQLCSETQ